MKKIIERLNTKKEELENKCYSLTNSSVPKIILQNKIDILHELIDAYSSISPPASLTDAQQILDQQVGFEEQKKKILEKLEIERF